MICVPVLTITMPSASPVCVCHPVAVVGEPSGKGKWKIHLQGNWGGWGRLLRGWFTPHRGWGAGMGGSEANKKFVHLKSTSKFGPL